MFNPLMVSPLASLILPGVPYNTAYTIIVAAEAKTLLW